MCCTASLYDTGEVDASTGCLEQSTIIESAGWAGIGITGNGFRFKRKNGSRVCGATEDVNGFIFIMDQTAGRANNLPMHDETIVHVVS